MIETLARNHTPTPSWGVKDEAHRKVRLQADAGVRLAELVRPWGRVQTEAPAASRGLIMLPSTSAGAPLEMVRAEDGPSLRDHIAGRSEVDIARSVGIARAMASALATVHACHVLHGSLSVDSILVGPGFDAVDIVDFTAAVKLAPAASLSVGAVRGAHDDLAWTPELAGPSDRLLDHRADLYALGGALYHLFAGRPVFDIEDPIALAHAHLAKSPVPPREVADVPPAVSAIVMALLRKQPGERYQRAVNLLKDLDACLRDLRSGADVVAFPLRLRSAPSTLNQGETLYGRDAQRGQLSKALAAAKAGRPQRLLVTGTAGAGKTALCRSFARQVAADGGLAGLGKFEQFGTRLPYLGLVRCFEDLIGGIHRGHDHRGHDHRGHDHRGHDHRGHEDIGRLSRAIVDKLNGNLAILVAILPTLGTLLGVAVPAESLVGAGAQDRLAQSFLGLLDALASPDRPVVLFLDDLQWADSASLDILGRISADLAGSVVLVGTARTEWDEAATLTGIGRALASDDDPPVRLDLIPLNRSDVEDLMLGLFGPQRLVVEAAAVVYAKTLGNPLFVCQFLQGLDEDSVFDPAGSTWDIVAVAAIDGVADVAAFLSARIGSLDDVSRAVLVTSSCFGMSFDRAGLRSLLDVPDHVLAGHLAALVDQGFFLPFDDQYHFTHDRVREAAYLLAVDRERIHRRIGQHLLALHADGGLPGAAFTIARHLQAAGSLSGFPELEERCFDVLFLAAQRAHDAAAFDLARSYAEAVLADASRWTDRYDVMAAALILKADSTASCQDHASFDREYEDGAAWLRTDEHRLRLALVRVLSLNGRAFYAEALDVGLEALRIVGIDLPSDPQRQGEALLDEFAAFQRATASRPPEDLADLPALGPSCTAVAMQILFLLAPNAHTLMRSELFALMAVRNVNLMLAHGKGAFASGILMTVAIVLARLAQDAELAESYAKAAMELDVREGRRTPAAVSFIHTYFFSHWTLPLEASLPSNLDGMRSGFAMGDRQFGSFHAAAYVIHLAGTGAALREVVRAGREHDRLIAGRIRSSSFHCRLEVAFAEALLGMTRSPLRLLGLTSLPDPPRPDEDGEPRVEDVLRDAQGLARTMSGFFIARHLQLAYLFGAWDDAEALAAALPGLMPAIAGNLVEADVVTFALLTALATGRRPSSFERDRARLEGWAHRNPGNFGCRHALVAAEIAAREGRVTDALGLYARAVGDATARNFTHFAALASERAGRFLLDLGDRTAGRAHLAEALRLYAAWGADAKASALDAEFALARDRPSAGLGGHDLGRPALEFTAVLAAARSISAEIEIDKLLHRLMTSVQEVSGASYGALILMQDGQPFVEVVSRHGQSASASDVLAHPLDRSSLVPRSVVARVERDRRTLVLENARSSDFARDPYIRDNPVASILCAPLMERGRLDGFVYVENDLTVAAFDPRSAQAIQMLAAQAAIALNNARLFGMLDRARADLAQANHDLERRVASRTSELAKAHDLALEKVVEADRAREAEARANTAKSRLLSVVSHEIRTPMNGVLGMLQLLDRSHLEPRERRQVDLAERSGFALVKLIDDILDYSRLELGPDGAADEAFDVDDLVEGSVEIFRASAEAKGLALVVGQGVPAGVVLRSDARGIGRVVANLVGNAVKFTDAGRVTVALRLEDGGTCDGGACDGRADRAEHLHLRVEDTGIGIDETMQGRIFGDFVQADASVARRYGGTGLGLAIARRTLALLGGTIAVESTPGVGSAFDVRVPVFRVDGVGEAAPTAEAGPPLRVLVVDDDEINREVASGLLRRLGHAVTCAEGWAAAVSAAQARAFDAVVLDLHMPDVDGFETASRIRQAVDPRPCPPMLLLTADATEASLSRSRGAGIAKVLHKPLRLDALAAALAGIGRTRDVAAPVPALPPLPPAVDPSQFAERCDMLGVSQVVRLLRMYDRRSREAVEGMAEAIATRDRGGVAKIAHRLRSASGSLELREMEERCRLIEADADADMDGGRLTGAVAELRPARKRAVAAALGAVRVFAASEGAPAAAGRGHVQPPRSTPKPRR